MTTVIICDRLWLSVIVCDYLWLLFNNFRQPVPTSWEQRLPWKYELAAYLCFDLMMSFDNSQFYKGFDITIRKEVEERVHENGCTISLFCCNCMERQFKVGGFAAKGDSQNQCMNGVFGANKTDLITPSCLNLCLWRILLEVIRETEKLGVD